LDPNGGRIDVDLDMWGHPDLGVLLIHSKWGGGVKEMSSSKGDLTRLGKWVRSKQGTLLPAGLFIPYGTAWKAVRNSRKQTASFQRALNGLPTAIFHGVHSSIDQPPQLRRPATAAIRTGPSDRCTGEDSTPKVCILALFR
jgi:hypothetical protein